MDETTTLLSELQDVAGSGSIDAAAFGAWWRALAPTSKAKGVVVSGWFLMRQLYKKYDADGSGNLDQSELGQLFADHSVPMTSEELAIAFSTMDKDSDGQVSSRDFETFWNSTVLL